MTYPKTIPASDIPIDIRQLPPSAQIAWAIHTESEASGLDLTAVIYSDGSVTVSERVKHANNQINKPNPAA
jgi:hypothetical protein